MKEISAQSFIPYVQDAYEFYKEFSPRSPNVAKALFLMMLFSQINAVSTSGLDLSNSIYSI